MHHYVLVKMGDVVGERLREGIGNFFTIEAAERRRLTFADADMWAIVRVFTEPGTAQWGTKEPGR